MMIALVAAGSGAILAGLAAILYGFLLDLSFGNTLILAGAFGVCSGMIVLAQAVVVRELKSIAAKLGPHLAAESRARRALAAAAAVEDSLSAAPESAPPGPPPWREEVISRDRAREAPPVAPGIAPPPEVVEPTPASPKRRNLLFSSNVRKDREHPAERPFEARSSDAAPPPVPAVESAPAGFDDAWPRAERTRLSEASVLRRVLRAPSSPAEKGAAANATERAAPAARSEDPSPAASPAGAAAVTVVKSGVVDGMAYSLYSDGSIEAQMPEGMMHFTSIDELRAHLDQRQ
jgi:hypothetical protein